MSLSRTDKPFCYACISILKLSVSMLGGVMCFTIDSKPYMQEWVLLLYLVLLPYLENV